MKKSLVSPGARGPGGGGFLLHIGRDLFHPPMVIVKASDHRQRMIDGAIGSRLCYRMSRKHLERTRWKFEPEDKTREVIQGNLLPVEALLEQEFPILPERGCI